MTVREWLQHAPSTVSRRDAETLALHVVNRDRVWLHAHPAAELTGEQTSALVVLIARRAHGEPLQYLTGHQEFFGLDLRVTPDVLIPRPETEHLVEAVLAWASEQARGRTGDLKLLDVGTGSGAIALALAAHLRDAQITALDVSDAALAVARGNAEKLGLAGRVRFLRSDLLDALQADVKAGLRFDGLASNPPYVAETDKEQLAVEVRDHEPALALFAGPDGMEVYRRLIPAAGSALRPGGLLAMEFGYGQRALMEELFRVQPQGLWERPEFLPDLQGIPRVVTAIRA